MYDRLIQIAYLFTLKKKLLVYFQLSNYEFDLAASFAAGDNHDCYI